MDENNKALAHYGLGTIITFAVEMSRTSILGRVVCENTCFSMSKFATTVTAFPSVFLEGGLGIAFSFLWVGIVIAVLATILKKTTPLSPTLALWSGAGVLLLAQIVSLFFFL